MPGKMLSHKDYSVGWVCALPKEQTAAIAMLDEEHPWLPTPATDANAYTLGSVGGHNVVVACLPMGKTGNSSSAVVAARMVSTFPAIKVCLMVGIAGSAAKDVRLGDVVVSTPFGEHPGVVQWDFGKSVNGGSGFQRTGALNNPPTSVLTNLTRLRSRHEARGTCIPDYLAKMAGNKRLKKYTDAATLEDVLFKPEYVHVGGVDNCGPCDKAMAVERDPREDDDDITVHYGLIASGNQVVKDAVKRDEINRLLGGYVLCLEMEAAGLMNDFPCLVIRGICDYADSHKNKKWQEYAAGVAAAYAKEFLVMLEVQEVEREKAIVGAIEELRDEIREVASVQRTQEDQAILNWLTLLDYASEQSRNIEWCQPGTGQWLLDSAAFKEWRDNKGRTLFLPGDPGVGKTILSSVVIDHLDQAFSSSRDVAIVYIYLNYNRSEDQAYGELLASLLKQLAQSLPSLPNEVKALHQKHHPKTRARQQEIRGALVPVARRCSRLFIVLDALDEGRLPWESLQKEVLNLQQRCDANIFATSRPIQKIADSFRMGATLRVEIPQADMERYLAGNMHRLPGCFWKLKDCERAELQAEITREILKAASGVFLLVHLLFTDLLNNKPTIDALRRGLKTLPRGPKAYDSAYENSMARIQRAPPRERTFAMQILEWIVHARRPLTAAELQHALAIEAGDARLDPDKVPAAEDMADACDGLVALDVRMGVLRLANHTAHEYLARTRATWFAAGAEWRLTSACAAYLLLDAFRHGPCRDDAAFEARLREHPFYAYAASHWGDHAAAVGAAGGKLPGVVRELLDDPPRMDAAVQALVAGGQEWVWEEYSQKAPTGVAALHLAACFGAVNIVLELLGRPPVDAVEARDSELRTPLAWAAVYDRPEAAEVLLDTGKADPNARDGRGRTPLALAAAYGSEGVIRLLLGRQGVDAGVVDEDGCTPLALTVRNGHEGAVRVFLQELRPRGEAVHDAAWWAIQQGDEAIFRHLLDATKADDTYWRETAGPMLLWAVESGQLAITRFLLAMAEVDASYRNDRGETPLIKAALMCCEEVLKLLLDSTDADPNLKDNQGRTALSIAAECGYTQIAACLLSLDGIDVNCRDLFSRTPIYLASDGGHESVVRALLGSGKGVDPNLKDWDGRTPLSRAENEGHWGIAELLKKSGATKTVPSGDSGGYGGQEMHLKIREQREELERLARARVDDSDAESDDGPDFDVRDIVEDENTGSGNGVGEERERDTDAKSDTSKDERDSGLDLSHLGIVCHGEDNGLDRLDALPPPSNSPDILTGPDAEQRLTAPAEVDGHQDVSEPTDALLDVATSRSIPRSSACEKGMEKTVTADLDDRDRSHNPPGTVEDDGSRELSDGDSDDDLDGDSDGTSDTGSEMSDSNTRESFQDRYRRVMGKSLC